MHVLLRRFVNIYVNTTLAYGFTRAVTYDYEGEKKYYNEKKEKYEKKEMLIFDKIGQISAKTFAALFGWPFMLGDDLPRLECAVLGKDHREYK